MNNKRIAVGLALLVFTLILAGCNRSTSSGKGKDTIKSPLEIEKQTLIADIERNFEDPQLHYKLGKIYQSQGLWLKADEQFMFTLNFNPVHRNAQASRIKVLLNSRQDDKAKILQEYFMQQASNSASASLRLGMAFQDEQLEEHALLCYQQALRLAPDSAAVNKQIGLYYLSKDDKNRAKDYLIRSYQLNWNQPEVTGELGRMGVAIERPAKKRESAKQVDKAYDAALNENNP